MQCVGWQIVVDLQSFAILSALGMHLLKRIEDVIANIETTTACAFMFLLLFTFCSLLVDGEAHIFLQSWTLTPSGLVTNYKLLFCLCVCYY